MPVRIANWEDPDQRQSDLGLPCLCRLFRQETSVLNFKTFTASQKPPLNTYIVVYSGARCLNILSEPSPTSIRCVCET